MDSPAIPVGTQVKIDLVRVLLLDGTTVETGDSEVLAQQLFSAFAVREGEIEHDERFIRYGFQQIAFVCSCPEVVGEKFELTFPQHEFPRWELAGGPPVHGDHKHVEGLRELGLPCLIMPGPTGQEIGEFFHLLASDGEREACLLVCLSSVRAGTLSRDNYVALSLVTSPGAIGCGTVSLVCDGSRGAMQYLLYQWEGGDSEEGRGDHVGAYPQRTFGP